METDSASLAAKALFDALPGQWTLNRTIGSTGTVTGLARFRRVGDDLLHYREDGRLSLGADWSNDVYREYFYILEAGTIRIAFAQEGAPGATMHRLVPPADAATHWPTVARDVHLCGEDTYDGTYFFDDRNHVRTSIVVSGPTKDYTIDTRLARLLQ